MLLSPIVVAQEENERGTATFLKQPRNFLEWIFSEVAYSERRLRIRAGTDFERAVSVDFSSSFAFGTLCGWSHLEQGPELRRVRLRRAWADAKTESKDADAG